MASEPLAPSGRLLVATDRAWWRVRDVRYRVPPLDLAAPVRHVLGGCYTRHLTLLSNSASPRSGTGSLSPGPRAWAVQRRTDCITGVDRHCADIQVIHNAGGPRGQHGERSQWRAVRWPPVGSFWRPLTVDPGIRAGLRPGDPKSSTAAAVNRCGAAGTRVVSEPGGGRSELGRRELLSKTADLIEGLCEGSLDLCSGGL
jgi:hypothetical protein